MSDTLATLATAIIKEQELVVGPLAWVEANKVSGLTVKDHTISVKDGGEGKKVLESLVKQYGNLFGQASIEVCKDAVKKLLAGVDKKDVPEILQ